jgi:hypothetical protein
MNCYSNFLKKELEIFKPQIVFVVGTAGEKWLERLPAGPPFR